MISRVRAAMLGAALSCSAAVWAPAVAADSLRGPHIEVTDAWVRATVPGQPATAAYLRIASDADLRLAAISTPAAQRCEVHETTLVNDIMHMREVADLRIQAGVPVAFEENHRHLMLQGLSRPLLAGQKVRFTLTFVDAQAARHPVTIEATVRASR